MMKMTIKVFLVAYTIFLSVYNYDRKEVSTYWFMVMIYWLVNVLEGM